MLLGKEDIGMNAISMWLGEYYYDVTCCKKMIQMFEKKVGIAKWWVLNCFLMKLKACNIHAVSF